MKWFTTRQNNSGGSFVEDGVVGVYVSVQAETPEKAEDKMHEVTNESGDNWCQCCGPRWEYFDFKESDGHGEPTYYGEPLSATTGWVVGDSVVLHFADGRVESAVVSGVSK